MFRYRLRTLLICAMVAPPVLAYCLSVEDGWQSLAGIGLIIAWLAIFFFTNVDLPKPP